MGGRDEEFLEHNWRTGTEESRAWSLLEDM